MIEPLEEAYYSGMVPGCIAMQYTHEQTRIKLEPLIEWSDATHIRGRVVGIDPVTQLLDVALVEPDGATLTVKHTSVTYEVIRGAGHQS